jgi:hypothetical protein
VTRGARNPVTLDRLIDAGLAAVTVDDQWRAEELAALAGRFRLFDPERLQRHSLPVVDAVIGGADVLKLVDAEATPVLDLFRGADPAAVAVAPSDVRVQVLNGTGRSGEAGELSTGLAGVGFTTVGTGEAERFDIAQTTVRYTAGNEAAADLVARYLDPQAVIEPVDGPLGADVVVVTGRDLVGVRAEPLPSTSTTTPSGTSTTSPDTTNPEPTTTTTAVGQVPLPPEGVDC